MRVLCLLAVAAAIPALAACGAGDHGAGNVDLAGVQADIRPHLQAQLREQTGDRSLRVRSVDCIAKSNQDARCIAYIAAGGQSARLAIHVDIDPHTGANIWSVEGGAAAALPMTTAASENSGAPLSGMTVTDEFSTPSRGITCEALQAEQDGSTGVRCKILSAMSQSGSVPVAELKDTGKPRMRFVTEPDAVATGATTIPYGQTWSVLPGLPRGGGAALACSSHTAGLTCENTDGHGFTIAATRQHTF